MSVQDLFAPTAYLDNVLKTLLRLLADALSALHPRIAKQPLPIRVVCIADTHTLRPSISLPDGDLLIHAGDLTNTGTPDSIQEQIDWISALPHKHKVVIAGNHDTYLDPKSRKTLQSRDLIDAKIDWKDIHYLEQSSVTLDFSSADNKRSRILHLYGAPQIPKCGGIEHAFQYSRTEDQWTDSIPADTDILITHTPPKFHFDLPVGLGCETLLREVWRVRPRLHVFGHVHAGRTDMMGSLKGGREIVRWGRSQRVLERGLRREDAPFEGLLTILGWLDLTLLFGYGVAELVWARVCGGHKDATEMVIASLMYNDSGELRNPPQVVDI